jgi:hypothetical protein
MAVHHVRCKREYVRTQDDSEVYEKAVEIKQEFEALEHTKASD